MVDGIEMFYREAGSPDRPAVLFLHGFPSSSHMFRHLIPALADRYHVVAPDYPGFGFSAFPERDRFAYTFAAYADLVAKFTDVIGLSRYACTSRTMALPSACGLRSRGPAASRRSWCRTAMPTRRG